ncbi:MAG: hypothetical protein ABIH23_14495 [bacterium]
MKRMYLIGLAVLLLTGVGVYADNVPIYTPEATLSHTITAADVDTTVNNIRDTVVLGPVFLDPRYRTWRRSIFIENLDTTFNADSVYIITQTAPFKHLTARASATVLGWTNIDSTKVIYAADRSDLDTIIQLAPRFELDSLATAGWNQAVWCRVIIRHGYTISNLAADTALIGESFGLKVHYWLLPTMGL